ncbi:hypothetical protein FH609_019365 [Streptomyces sp. 3MP-14]|uniref:Uncharacterized protein n=2 Tax=Streptomyces TaxID=1883 RepID=A0A5N6A7D0_9ACTN|nr:hypothetical protein FH607_017905 [Streptomyces mimosae]KAB8175346.1 hypothetical protein FH609_019365 [Streptomyces sp. 3MP-14]
MDASTSDRQRERLAQVRLRAAEVGAAEEIRAYYAGRSVPLPDGVSAPSEEELWAADETEG